MLEETLPPVFKATRDDIEAAFGSLVTDVDAAYLTDDFADYVARSFRRSGVQGVVGARDDGLALVAPWGFDLATITVPVAVWQGRQDAMVPFAHGQWLAEHVAGATAHLFEDEGHLSLFSQLDRLLADLKDKAGSDPGRHRRRPTPVQKERTTAEIAPRSRTTAVPMAATTRHVLRGGSRNGLSHVVVRGGVC